MDSSIDHKKLARARTPNEASASAGPRIAEGRPLTAFPGALVEAILARATGSNTFRRSVRHRRFLEYLVRTTLAGHVERLKEVVIGIEVFGRSVADYDPRTDPIVRVEAGRLRDKLARYYSGEGAGESFELVIPIGGYGPHLARRTGAGRATRDLGSFAVLPLASLSGRDDDAAFSVGLADQLIDTLGRLPGLKVVARTSSLQAGERGGDAKTVGRLLGVTHVIEGSLQRSGRRLRCIAHLSRTADGVRLWSQRFDLAGEDDLFAFQDEIADAVLTAVAAQTAARDPRLVRSLATRAAGTDERAARDLFERGRYMAQQLSIDGFRKAIELFERAVAIDTSYARAHTALAAAHANLAGMIVGPSLDAYRAADAAARNALAADPLDGDAHAILAALAYRFQFEWKKSQPMFREALRLAPSSTVPHSGYAWALVFNGHPAEALRHARIAQELDPLNLGLRANNAFIHAYAREIEFALTESRAVLELDPDHLYSHIVSGMAHLWSASPERALPHFEFVMRALPEHTAAWFGRICVLGLRGTADALAQGRRELAALVARFGGRHYSHVHRAMAEASVGDRDGVLASLDRAADERDMLFVSVPADRLFDRYHADAAFVELLGRHGLELSPAYRTIDP